MTTLLRNVNLSAPDHGQASGPVDVLFGRTVSAIRSSSGELSDGADVVDGAGGFLVPGLIDTHVHLGSHKALTDAVTAGITTMVDLGTHPDSLVEEQRGAADGPSIISAGSAASAPGSTQISLMGFPEESGVKDAADAERYLEWRVSNGVDLIKIIIEDPQSTDVPALDADTLTALVDGAHERGLMTVAHVVTAGAFERGLDAGVDVLTHAPLDRVLPESTVRRMIEQGTTASPTLVMMRAMAQARLGDHADEAFRVSLDSVRAMVQAGVPIVSGTDANETPIAPVPHGASLHDEMGLLTEAGLTPAEALNAATGAAAEAFGLSDRGLIGEGRRADFVLVDSDPVADPSVLRSPRRVWVAGSEAAAR